MIRDPPPLQVVDLAGSDAAVTSDPPGPLVSDKWMPPESGPRGRPDKAQSALRVAAIVRDLPAPAWSPGVVVVRRLMIEASGRESGRLLAPQSELVWAMP